MYYTILVTTQKILYNEKLIIIGIKIHYII